jgi:hypothetical protein
MMEKKPEPEKKPKLDLRPVKTPDGEFENQYEYLRSLLHSIIAASVLEWLLVLRRDFGPNIIPELKEYLRRRKYPVMKWELKIIEMSEKNLDSFEAFLREGLEYKPPKDKNAMYG